jgi:hypothetical protein
LETDRLQIADSEFGDGYWLFEKDLQDRQCGPYHAKNNRPWSALIPEGEVPNLRAWARSYSERMLETLECTSFFVTENDLYGISPSPVEEGDILCILFGCKLPAVLRSQKDKYSLVSLAYVPGIMQGEFFEDRSNIATTKRRFEII